MKVIDYNNPSSQSYLQQITNNSINKTPSTGGYNNYQPNTPGTLSKTPGGGQTSNKNVFIYFLLI